MVYHGALQKALRLSRRAQEYYFLIFWVGHGDVFLALPRSYNNGVNNEQG
jgi:hypothetical protein